VRVQNDGEGRERMEVRLGWKRPPFPPSSRLLGRRRAPSPLGRGAGLLWVLLVSEWGGGGVVWVTENERRRGVLALYARGGAR
jgi:hypothetical protein